jgi:hypothetical protein
MLRIIKYAWEGRSSKWSGVRRSHLNNKSSCACCDAVKDLEVHHIIPFSIAPDLELDPNNLVTLCKYCHLVIGHLRDNRIYNPNLMLDIQVFRMNRKFAYRSFKNEAYRC